MTKIVATLFLTACLFAPLQTHASILDLPGVTFRPGHPELGESLEQSFNSTSSRESDGFVALNITIERLKKYPDVLFSVSGHVDAQECVKYQCVDLAMRRARLVYHYLLKHGIAPERLFELTSYGSSRPLVEDPKAVDRSGNRRVDIDVAPYL